MPACAEPAKGYSVVGIDVPLFDVVPWSYGYAHSWALRWMLANDQTGRDRLLGVFLPDGKAPWRLEHMTREFPVGRSRVDLRVEAIDAAGERTEVLLETKVNDAVKEAQIKAYCSTRATVILYGPGLTGLLHTDGDQIDRERWITGRQVTDALGGVSQLPDLILSYLTEVATQTDRMEAAREAARGGPDLDHSDDISEVSAEEVEAVAWVAEVAAAMRARGAEWIHPGNTAHDHGIFWGGSWHAIPAGDDVGVFVDIVAAHGGWEYAITIKVGGGEADARGRLFDAAMRAGPPWDGWVRGRRSRAEAFRSKGAARGCCSPATYTAGTSPTVPSAALKR